MPSTSRSASTTICSGSSRAENVALEEYARTLIEAEEEHIDEIDKMLRKPGEVEMSKEARDFG